MNNKAIVCHTKNNNLVALMEELEDVKIYAEVNRLLRVGEPVTSILDSCQEGLRRLGEHYQQEHFFLAGLVMASEIMKGVYRIIKPRIENSEGRSKEQGVIVVGTILGDIHDIAKNMFASQLDFYGYDVVDLGTNIPPEKFQQTAMELSPDLVCISVTLTNCYKATKMAINLIKDCRMATNAVKPGILLGGCSINQEVATRLGADHWLIDVVSGFDLCKKLIEGSNPSSV